MAFLHVLSKLVVTVTGITTGINNLEVVTAKLGNIHIPHHYIMSEVLMLDIQRSSSLGIHSLVPDGIIEIREGASQLRLTAIGGLLAAIASGEYVTLLIGLAYIAIDETKTGLVLYKQS